jgi:hypothetical protein
VERQPCENRQIFACRAGPFASRSLPRFVMRAKNTRLGFCNMPSVRKARSAPHNCRLPSDRFRATIRAASAAAEATLRISVSVARGYRRPLLALQLLKDKKHYGNAQSEHQLAKLKRRVAHPGIADDSSGRGIPQLEVQPQQPGSIADLTENLALSIKNIQPIDSYIIAGFRTNGIPPQRDQGYAACKSTCTLINTTGQLQ